jgi:uncharacterized membrane protein (UPF0136 family)
MLTQIFYFVFGIAAIAGGALGFARAKSKPSLIAGAVSGALLIIAGLLAGRIAAYVIALIVSVLLLLHFGRSYASKRKPMPAIPMIVLSVICIVLTLVEWHMA